jgi:membrane protein DedA with SNARE-associated domain
MFSILGELTDLVVFVLATTGLTGLFLLIGVSNVGIPPIPSEVILPLSGFLIVEGTFSLVPTIVVALLGGLAGSFAGYAIGRWWRDRITGMGVGRLRLEARHLARVDRYFAEHGELAVALLRLVPVLRAYVSYPAGTARMNTFRFGVFTFVGSVPYTLILIYAGMVLRSDWTLVSQYLALLNYPLLAVIVLVVVYVLLQIAGVLAPGWPPRRAHAPPPPETARPPGPA